MTHRNANISATARTAMRLDAATGLESRVPRRLPRVLQLEVDVELSEQRAFSMPQPQARVLQTDIGLNLVALRGYQVTLELQQRVGGCQADAVLRLSVMQSLGGVNGSLARGVDLLLEGGQVGQRTFDQQHRLVQRLSILHPALVIGDVRLRQRR